MNSGIPVTGFRWEANQIRSLFGSRLFDKIVCLKMHRFLVPRGTQATAALMIVKPWLRTKLLAMKLRTP